MSALSSESIAAHVQDYECLIEGVVYFLGLELEIVKQGNIEAIRRHYDQNPEDKLCHIYRPGTRDMLQCRRSGIEAIQRMSLRLVSEATNGCDLSPQRIAEIISERVFQVAIDSVTEDEELVRILRSYVGDSETEHVEAAYHFPCVLLHCGPHHPDLGPPTPEEFSLGPVTFQQIEGFLRKFNEATQAGRKSPQEKAIDIFTESGKKYGWVASVRIPRCAPDVSRRRAEEIVEAAINLLKVFIGLRYGRSMRLPHTAPARNRETCVLTDIDNNVEWTWQGRSLDGALVAGDPLAGIPACLRSCASNLLTEGLSGDRDEVTNRLLDALKWFGDASFEESGGVQIVKWIAALERLSATERLDNGITHRFCKRVALLASGLGTGHVEKAYRDARKAYDLRSEVMHGSRSQDDEHLLINTGVVHDLTREAILGAIATHHLLGTTIGNVRMASMGRFYEKSAHRHEALFTQLQQEFGKKARSKKASP
jgi:Apea-like HEPN